MTAVCVIPARGGSKGVPGKNIREVAGKPLIVWTIEQALAVTEPLEVVVSTDDDEIASVARAAGASVPFLRPAELAQDTTATEPVVRHALATLDALGTQASAVMLLQATSPVRLPGTLDRALAEFASTGVDSLVGVVPQAPFLWWAGDPPRADYAVDARPRRQDLTSETLRYRETGSLYVTRRWVYDDLDNRLGGRIGLFVMDEVEGTDVDTELDLAVAEQQLRGLRWVRWSTGCWRTTSHSSSADSSTGSQGTGRPSWCTSTAARTWVRSRRPPRPGALPLRRVKVNWGGYSLARAMFTVVEDALAADPDATHVQLLSGVDYPARPEADLEEHLVPGRSYVNFYPMLPGSQFDTIPHTWCFHDQYALLPERWGRRAYRLVDRLNRRLPARTPPVTLYRGSVWMCLARPAAEYVVGATRDREHRRVMRYLRTINVPDEIAVQTLLAHSPLSTTLDGWRVARSARRRSASTTTTSTGTPTARTPPYSTSTTFPRSARRGSSSSGRSPRAAPHGSWTSSTRLSADRGARPLPPARRAARSTSRLPSTSSLQAVAPP